MSAVAFVVCGRILCTFFMIVVVVIVTAAGLYLYNNEHEPFFFGDAIATDVVAVSTVTVAIAATKVHTCEV